MSVEQQQGRKVVIVLMKTPEGDATLTAVQADCPELEIRDFKTYYEIVGLDEIRIDLDRHHEPMAGQHEQLHRPGGLRRPTFPGHRRDAAARSLTVGDGLMVVTTLRDDHAVVPGHDVSAMIRRAACSPRQALVLVDEQEK
jgi:hypothetical protein